MASPAERRRNNIRAGVFVSVAVLMGVAIIVVLSGVWQTLTQATRPYTVEYPVSAGVNNLKSGSEVRIGGVVMGRVGAVRPKTQGSGAFDAIEVDFRVSDRIRLFGDASIFVTSPLLGTDAWLDIPSVGSPGAGEATGRVISGSASVGLLSTMLGAANAAKTTRIVDNTVSFSEFLADVPEQYRSEVVPILDNMESATADAKALAAGIRGEDWPRWSGKADEIMAWANDFTGRVDAALAEGQGLFADARDVIAENREPMHVVVTNAEATSADVREVAERLRSETVDRVHRFLDTGQEALESARSTLRTIETDYEGWSVDLGDTVGNAALASQQLKLATIEVRRSPWKLLYRPTEREVEHELLYDAARSFALAAADLKAASQSAQAVLDRHSDRLAEDPGLLDQIRRNLVEPLQNYERAQTRLLDVLLESP